jgi:hypothetical protein
VDGSGRASADDVNFGGDEQMGLHSMNRPPKFVQGFIDRHGKPRFYVG